ncbi:MAG TPA: hypothetical protein PLF84_09025 [Bryobacteraceae bacterium]|nr:hypothetical protein [Bryobacteraceae bacterium]
MKPCVVLLIGILTTVANGQSNDPPLGVVGVFPHYAVGESWASAIYMNVDGKGRNLNGSELASCKYSLQFLDQFGNLRHTHTFSRTAQYSFENNVIKLDVPDFNSGALAFGPVVVSSDCSESFPVKTGELVFTQSVAGRKIDGTIRYKRYDTEDSGIIELGKFVYGFALFNPSQNAKAVFVTVYEETIRYKRYDTEDSGIIELGKFVYGFALFNPSQNAKAVFVTVYEEATKTEIVENKLLLTLAGREQRIFVLTDLLPELSGRSGLHVISFSNSPYEGLYQSVYHLMLKFNDTGAFSSGVMY